MNYKIQTINNDNIKELKVLCEDTLSYLNYEITIPNILKDYAAVISEYIIKDNLLDSNGEVDLDLLDGLDVEFEFKHLNLDIFNKNIYLNKHNYTNELFFRVLHNHNINNYHYFLLHIKFNIIEDLINMFELSEYKFYDFLQSNYK